MGLRNAFPEIRGPRKSAEFPEIAIFAEIRGPRKSRGRPRSRGLPEIKWAHEMRELTGNPWAPKSWATKSADHGNPYDAIAWATDVTFTRCVRHRKRGLRVASSPTVAWARGNLRGTNRGALQNRVGPTVNGYRKSLRVAVVKAHKSTCDPINQWAPEIYVGHSGNRDGLGNPRGPRDAWAHGEIVEPTEIRVG